MRQLNYLVGTALALIALSCSKPAEVKAVVKTEEKTPEVYMAQADSYFLYSYALRDARNLKGAEAPDMKVRTEGTVTFFEFTDHVIRECGTHLTGTVRVDDLGDVFSVEADFYKVEENPYEITSFRFDITEPKENFRKSDGIATVNGTEYPIREIIKVSRF